MKFSSVRLCLLKIFSIYKVYGTITKIEKVKNIPKTGFRKHTSRMIRRIGVCIRQIRFHFPAQPILSFQFHPSPSKFERQRNFREQPCQFLPPTMSVLKCRSAPRHLNLQEYQVSKKRPRSSLWIVYKVVYCVVKVQNDDGYRLPPFRKCSEPF